MLPKLIPNFCMILFNNPVEIENEVIFEMLLREYRGISKYFANFHKILRLLKIIYFWDVITGV